MAIEIFFSDAHKDEKLREELEKQLSLLKWQGIRKVVQELLREPLMDNVAAHFDRRNGEAILTGFEDLDRLTGGLQHSDLIIVPTPPATGKTGFALSIALNVAAKHAQSVGFLALK